MLGLVACSTQQDDAENTPIEPSATITGKPVIYQVLPRIFGNQNSTNKAWGTLQENGVGKFDDFTVKALTAIKEYGVTHIWYTGILHHDVITDYTEFGISNDDPDVVKGRAGSPYAIKDYYNVNPDLAVNPANRLNEFKSLLERSHKQNLKVIIDIVPNHIARNYHSISKPEGVEDFGETDDTSVEYKRDNNFYYVVGEAFQVPKADNGYLPLGGESHPLADGKFEENPAKWTGNGSRKAQPDINDWYETVKLNFGVKPDGSYDFDRLPTSFKDKNVAEHYQFWIDKDVPSSWKKFRDIVLYWSEMGVDGFRYDMAEMVPVEFWSYLNSSIKNHNPEAFIIAEVYDPSRYRDFIYLGKMDYLYDKVDFYDGLKLIIQGKKPTSILSSIIAAISDIDQHMLHFLENHDEQRIASVDFAGSGEQGKPAMVVSALAGKAPTMLFYGQALGEAGDGDAGFGDETRTTIYDYWGVDSLQRWSNNGAYDGALLTDKEKSLRQFYIKLLNFSSHSKALKGAFVDLHKYNTEYTEQYDQKLFSFARGSGDEKLLVISNFSATKSYKIEFQINNKLVKLWALKDGDYKLEEVLTGSESVLTVKQSIGVISMSLEPLDSKVFRLKSVD
ncbi:MAG: alpha-amylase [Gammaproteobacteria bacterium]|nr:MAG: alpha-amylase [Gammaproteobacteria bacterium]